MTNADPIIPSTPWISGPPADSALLRSLAIPQQTPVLLANAGGSNPGRGDGKLVEHPAAASIRKRHPPNALHSPRLKGDFEGVAGNRYDFCQWDIHGSSKFSGYYRGSNFKEAYVIQTSGGRNPVGASFRGDFQRAVFSFAFIQWSRFNADLRGSDFQHSALYGVDFGKSRLTAANFVSADLREADLSRVPDLHLARFGGNPPTLIDAKTKFPPAWTQDSGRGTILGDLLARNKLTYSEAEAHPKQVDNR